MTRLDYWKAKLKVAQAEEKQRAKEYNQMARAFLRAADKVTEIENKIEKAKLAKSE